MYYSKKKKKLLVLKLWTFYAHTHVCVCVCVCVKSSWFLLLDYNFGQWYFFSYFIELK